MASTFLTDPQPELPLARRAVPAQVSQEMVHAQRSSASALSLACQVSGLEDKEICLSLGIDAGHFSRIRKGDAGFPPDKLADFCRLVGNTIYPEWIAYQVGCTLVMLKSEAERRAEEAEQRAQEAEKRLAYLESFVRVTGGRS